jgi:hypothetical protein
VLAAASCGRHDTRSSIATTEHLSVLSTAQDLPDLCTATVGRSRLPKVQADIAQNLSGHTSRQVTGHERLRVNE